MIFYFQDQPIGEGNGVYKGQRLFKAKLKYASFVPAIGLLKEEDEDDPQPFSDSTVVNESEVSTREQQDQMCPPDRGRHSRDAGQRSNTVQATATASMNGRPAAENNFGRSFSVNSPGVKGGVNKSAVKAVGNGHSSIDVNANLKPHMLRKFWR